MMAPIDAKLRQYTWKDILDLVAQDVGLECHNDKDGRSEIWLKNGFKSPTHDTDVCMEIIIYNDDYRTRLQKRAREEI